MHPLLPQLVDLLTSGTTMDLTLVCKGDEGETLGTIPSQPLLNAMYYGYDIQDMHVEEAGGSEPIDMSDVASITLA